MFCAVYCGSAGTQPCLETSPPQQAPMGSQEEQRMSSAEDQPDIQQIYIERLGKRRKLIITNMCALPYRSREVMRGAVFLCRCACFNWSLIVFILGWWLKTVFWQTYHQLQLKTFFWGGMILIVAWLYCLHFLTTSIIYVYILHICIHWYVICMFVMSALAFNLPIEHYFEPKLSNKHAPTQLFWPFFVFSLMHVCSIYVDYTTLFPGVEVINKHVPNISTSLGSCWIGWFLLQRCAFS